MVYKNRYCKCSRSVEKTFRQLIRYFPLDMSASDAARLMGILISSMNIIYIKLRYRLAQDCEKHAVITGQVEVDESYFG